MRSGSRLSGSYPSAPATKPLSERKRRHWGSCLVWTDGLYIVLRGGERPRFVRDCASSNCASTR